MTKPIVVTDNWSKNWQAKIAVRISSIVLWSLTLLSMIVASLLISQVKQDTEHDQAKIMDQLAYKISEALLNNPQAMPEDLKTAVSDTLSEKNIEAIIIEYKNSKKLFGSMHSELAPITRTIRQPFPATITVCFIPLEQTVRDRQVEIFMYFSLSLVLLGAFLGLIIDKYVRKPFQHMEQATQEYIAGNKQVRLDITSKDEFGVLASFMNEMFDRIDQNEERLKREVQIRKTVAHQVAEQRDALQRLTSELTHARDEAYKANYAKSAFLANMSHELRTPLNAVIGYSELLIEETTDEHNEKYIPDLEKIRQAGKHLLALINDLLDISKIEAGKMELLLENFSIRSMIDDVSSLIQPMIEKNNNQLTIHLPAQLGNMYSDITRVKQILFNLLSNACKFTEDGEITLDVSINQNDVIHFKVIDNGIGIAEDKIEQLFQEFVQADDSTTRKHGGTGLGLAICRSLSRLMGGDIIASSTPGKGSIFEACIPLKVEPSIQLEAS